ncbi:MAG TPA: hypothetical protein ENF37_10395 [Beggiatoa sp.]|nr:MAG: hypothetical protein B6247_05270 [Beggiatoa sp. 4572_84]RKZ64421.1 MAG: hypothetical protein DRR08_00565 [Gammaproteobacteria bacterium]HEW99027.1 hypothetical protein [Beggiatoa sp.]
MRLNSLFHNLFTTRRGFVVLLFISITLGAGYGSFSLQQMNIEARGFVNTTMLGLLADWDESEFLIHASDDLRQQMTSEQLSKINVVFTCLGELLNYHGAKGGLFRSTAYWWHVSPRYKVLASFQGGQFVAVITLIKQQGNWVIGRFEYKYAYFPLQRHPGSLKMV